MTTMPSIPTATTTVLGVPVAETGEASAAAVAVVLPATVSGMAVHGSHVVTCAGGLVASRPTTERPNKRHHGTGIAGSERFMVGPLGYGAFLMDYEGDPYEDDEADDDEEDDGEAEQYFMASFLSDQAYLHRLTAPTTATSGQKRSNPPPRLTNSSLTAIPERSFKASCRIPEPQGTQRPEGSKPWPSNGTIHTSARSTHPVPGRPVSVLAPEICFPPWEC